MQRRRLRPSWRSARPTSPRTPNLQRPHSPEPSQRKMSMDKPMNVCVLVGSLRKASLNRMLANALMSLAPASLKLEIVEIGQLPFFNQDLETGSTPVQWTAFRERVKAADAVLFVTPEYNRS